MYEVVISLLQALRARDNVKAVSLLAELIGGVQAGHIVDDDIDKAVRSLQTAKLLPTHLSPPPIAETPLPTHAAPLFRRDADGNRVIG